MGSGESCFRPDPDGPVEWFRANGQESLEWQNSQSGFGYQRKKSYRQVARRSTKANRLGNFDGNLAGEVIFYQKALATTNYAYFPKHPTITLNSESRLYAKAFLDLPLSRIPIGQNNIVPSEDETDRIIVHGATLLAGRPRMVALYVWLNNVAYSPEVFCKASASASMHELEENPKPGTNEEDSSDEPRGVLLDKAMLGSFVTFMLARTQDPYCFIHLPLLGCHRDIDMATGYYAETLMKSFCELLNFAGPGLHTLRLSVQYWYDHCKYSYLPLGEGVNALGRWYSGLPNSHLCEPHQDPETLCTSAMPLAEGELTLIIPAEFNTKLHLKILEHDIPPEMYKEDDVVSLRKIARTVAAGRFCQRFGLSGVPDWVVLTSELETQHVTKADVNQTKATRDVLHFAALWLNTKNVKPDACGTMVEACMARGQVSPVYNTEEWVWILDPFNKPPRIPWPCPISNKLIKICKMGRRISVFSPTGQGILSRLKVPAWSSARK